MRFTTLLTAGLSLSFLGCDANVFSSFEDTGSPEFHAEEGRIALDHGDFETAIAELEQARDLDPSNVTYRVDLASGYAGRAGLSLLNVVYTVQDSEAADEEQFLRNVVSEDNLPTTDAATLADLNQAINLLRNDIEETDTTDEMRIQRAMVTLAAAAVTPLAIADKDGNRELDADEMMKLGDDAFSRVYTNIGNANADVKFVGQNNPDVSQLTDGVDRTLADIDSSDGSNTSERVQYYIVMQMGDETAKTALKCQRGQLSERECAAFAAGL